MWIDPGVEAKLSTKPLLASSRLRNEGKEGGDLAAPKYSSEIDVFLPWRSDMHKLETTINRYQPWSTMMNRYHPFSTMICLYQPWSTAIISFNQPINHNYPLSTIINHYQLSPPLILHSASQCSNHLQSLSFPTRPRMASSGTLSCGARCAAGGGAPTMVGRCGPWW